MEQRSGQESDWHHLTGAGARKNTRESQTQQDRDQRGGSHYFWQIAGGKAREEQAVAERFAGHLVGQHQRGSHDEDKPGPVWCVAIAH